MTASIEHELRAFATLLLERRGGLVEWPAGTAEGTAVVPEDLAAELGAEDETLRLSAQAGGEGWCVSLGTDFLDTAARLLEAEPRIGVFRVGEAYLKRGDLSDAVARAFAWLNARVRIHGSVPVRVEYHTWWFRASAVSEDRWETRFPLTLNAASGAEVELPDPLELWEAAPNRHAAAAAPATYPQAARRAQARAERLAADFFRRMDGRFARDQKRLREYYGSLLRETELKKRRGRAKPDPEKLEAGKRAVQLELRRKLAELNERYAVEITLQPLVLIRVEIPALAVELSVCRKRAQRAHRVYWNSLLKQLEPFCCASCGRGTFAVAFTNEDVAPLCPECAGRADREGVASHENQEKR